MVVLVYSFGYEPIAPDRLRAGASTRSALDGTPVYPVKHLKGGLRAWLF